MRSKSLTVSSSAGGNSHSGIYVPNINVTPFNIGFGAIVTTTARFTIQHTFDNPLETSADALTWFPHDTVVAASADIDSNFAFPVAGIRVEASADNGGGSVSVTFIQAGIRD